MADTLLIVALILSGFTTVLLINEVRKNQNAKIKQLEERISKLETANHKRINYTSLEDLENAMTALMILREDLSIRSNIVENAMAHLAKVHTPTKK